MSRNGPTGPYKRKPLADRFWPKVRRGEGCWEWTASTTSGGYGQLASGGGVTYGTPKPLPAHRVSWELHFGPIPEGMEVCHRCDNRICVRPDHLFLGTHSENVADMVAKGRSPNRKLTADEVSEIRRLHSEGYSARRLARDFGLDKVNILKIVRGEHYKGGSMTGQYERGVRECRCGIEIEADALAMLAHVTSDEHSQRLAERGLARITQSEDRFPETPDQN